MAITDREKIAIIDAYFLEKDAYSNVPYVPVGEIIVAECRAHGVGFLTITLACAVIEQESGGKNVFGCDSGWGADGRQAPFCNARVSRARLDQLIEYHAETGKSNGVGATQLTYWPYILQAEQAGGAHLLQNQIPIGLGIVSSNVNRWGYMEGLEAYNDGTPTLDDNNPYELQVAEKHYAWKQRLS